MRNDEDQKTIQWIVFPTHGFELGKDHFDRVEIGGVGWQKQHPVALGAQQCLDARRFVGGQVVGDDYLTGFERRGEFVLDIGLETRAVHRAVQNPRGQQAVAAQSRDEG